MHRKVLGLTILGLLSISAPAPIASADCPPGEVCGSAISSRGVPCTNAGRWGVSITINRGTGSAQGWMECSGYAVSYCSISGTAPASKDCGLQSSGSGTGHCWAEKLDGGPDFSFTVNCYDPIDPLLVLVVLWPPA